jgi:hypothetical protein
VTWEVPLAKQVSTPALLREAAARLELLHDAAAVMFADGIPEPAMKACRG